MWGGMFRDHESHKTLFPYLLKITYLRIFLDNVQFQGKVSVVVKT